LESNLESNASISLSLQADKMVSPGGFIASSSRASGDMHEQIIDLTGTYVQEAGNPSITHYQFSGFLFIPFPVIFLVKKNCNTFFFSVKLEWSLLDYCHFFST
jgi:hypothetical protein